MTADLALVLGLGVLGAILAAFLTLAAVHAPLCVRCGRPVRPWQSALMVSMGRKPSGEPLDLYWHKRHAPPLFRGQ